MNNNSYLIPANSKKSAQILGLFDYVDLIVFGTGTFVSVIALAITGGGSSLIQTFTILSPAIFTAILVIPFPNYHNIMGFIGSILHFFSNRRKYVWKGWCLHDQLKKY